MFTAASFNFPHHFPGPECNLSLHDGTGLRDQIWAETPFGTDLTGIQSGDTFASRLLSSLNNLASNASLHTPATNTSMPSAYPSPIVRHTANNVMGFHLDDVSTSDVAVLSILTFDDATNQTQTVIRDFLQQSQRAGKTKLIIDLQQNLGGKYYYAYELFKQVRRGRATSIVAQG